MEEDRGEGWREVCERGGAWVRSGGMCERGGAWVRSGGVCVRGVMGGAGEE